MRHQRALCLRLAAGILAVGCVTSVAADTVTIRADAWYPMNSEEGAEKQGYMIELAEAVFAMQDHEVDYQNMPWERALTSVREGKHDCVVGAYESDAPDFIMPEEHWGFDQSVFYVKPGTQWRYEGVESLAEVTVATIGGYAYGEAFDEYVEENPDTVEVINANNALEKNIRKVLGGRVDAILESPPVLKAQLQKMDMSGELESAGELAEPVRMYIACSPANEERSRKLVEWVDEGTRKLRESGKLDEILDRYGMEDWK